MTNWTLDGTEATEAKEWQIVNRIYPDTDFRDQAMDIAHDLAAGSTHLQKIAKDSFHIGWRRPLKEATEFEIQSAMHSVRQPGFKESLDRFIAGQTRGDAEIVRLRDGV